VAFERGFVHVELPAPLAINIAGRVEVFRDEGGTTYAADGPRLVSSAGLLCGW
jgi:hypothetical protein